MALKQSRRTVSLNRQMYDAAKLRAASLGVPLAQMVQDLLAQSGVKPAQVKSIEDVHSWDSEVRRLHNLGVIERAIAFRLGISTRDVYRSLARTEK